MKPSRMNSAALLESPAKKMGKGTLNVVRYVLLSLLGLFFAFPAIYMIICSFLTRDAAVSPETVIPRPSDFSLEAYQKVFEDVGLIDGLGNTLIVAALNIAGVVIAATFCAYGLTKVYFKGQKAMFAIILGTVFLPGTVTSIPLFTIYSKLGWVDTLLPLWLPIWFGGGAMNIFLIRQFMRGIPKSYTEAATIDGANSFQILLTVIVPLLKPILLYLAITTFIGCWNDYSGPLMYLTGGDIKTLALQLFETFRDDESFELNAQMAVGVLMMIPIAVLFGFFQNELTEGVANVGLKV